MWSETVGVLLEHLREHGLRYIIALGMTGIGWLLGRWRAQRSWKRKEFLGRINFSLNIVQPIQPDPDDPAAARYSLKIRTLAELDVRDAFLNDAAANAILKAAVRTTRENPLLDLSREDSWFSLNAILNELSERYSAGFLLQDAGVPVALHRYVICLTSEAAGTARTRKVRAMVVREDTLQKADWKMPFALESENHGTRVKTLSLMSEKLQSEPWRFLTMELPIGRETKPESARAASLG